MSNGRICRSLVGLLCLLVLACAPEGKHHYPSKLRLLFDGSSLENWAEAKFSQAGAVRLEGGAMTFTAGAPFTGVVYTGGDFPKVDYEISLTATKLEGDDFFCGLTLPYQDSHFTLIVGGWSGEVTGISSIDDADASQNETGIKIEYERNTPYRIRVRVTKPRIQVWIDERQITDVEVGGRKISLRAGEIGLCLPMGICSYFTRARIGSVQLRLLDEHPARHTRS